MKILLILLIAVTAVAMDNEINSNAPDWMFDGCDMYCGYHGLVSWNESRYLLQIDEGTAQPVKLWFYVFAIYPASPDTSKLEFYPIAELWQGNVTWNTQPEIGEKLASKSFGALIENGWNYIYLSKMPPYGIEIKVKNNPMGLLWLKSQESDYAPYYEISSNPNGLIAESSIESESLGVIKSIYK
jgi:hypothetical protein